MASKLWTLRIMRDAEGRMNRSVADVGGGLLVISQFTLYGDTSKGRRPSFVAAAPGEVAEPLVDRVVEHLRAWGPSRDGPFRRGHARRARQPRPGDCDPRHGSVSTSRI